MNIQDLLAALRPLEATHMTSQGVCAGFFMIEATRALGGLAQASDALAVLMAEGLVDSEPVVIGGDVHTLYVLAENAPTTTSASIH